MQKREKMYVILIILVLLILPFQVYRLRNRFEFNRRVRALAAEGYPVSRSDLEAAYVLPDGVDNAADVYQKAFDAYFEPNEAEEEWLPIRGYYVPSDKEPPYPPEVMEAIKTSLANNQECLELLDQAAQMEYCLFPRPRSGVGWNGWWYWDSLKIALKLLNERNLLLAQHGQTDELFESIHTCIRLTNTSRIQPLTYDHLSTIVFKGLVAANLQDCLNLTTFNDMQLTNLQQQIHLQWEDNITTHLINERAANIEIMHLPGPDILEYYKASSFFERSLFRLNTLLGLRDKDTLLMLDFYDKWIEIEQLPFNKQPKQLKNLKNEFNSCFRLFHCALYYALPSFRVSEAYLRIVSQLQCAETALAVERYRLKYQRLPESLEALVPEFIETVYLDPFDGEPLRYQLRDEGGYTIYCIGEDGVDNGGLSQDQMYMQSENADTDECDYPFTVKK